LNSFCAFELREICLQWLEPMALEMKKECEKCGRALAADHEACICSYECTFCPECAQQMDFVCPNCAGELVRRPRQKPDGR
jgi:uncharacterized protein